MGRSREVWVEQSWSKYGSRRCLGRAEADRKIAERAVVVNAKRNKNEPRAPLVGVKGSGVLKKGKGGKKIQKNQQKGLTEPTLQEMSD